MNEIHIAGVVKYSWRYDGHLYLRVSVARDGQRPRRVPAQGGSYDYLTVVLPGGASQGLQVARGQRITAHGWLQSRDIHEALVEFVRRALGRDAVLPALPPELAQLTVHRSINEVVAERWTLRGPARAGEPPSGASLAQTPST